MVKSFGIKKKNKTNKFLDFFSGINVFFLLSVIFSFSLFFVLNSLSGRIKQWDKIDIAKDNISELAFYFRSVDIGVSDTLLEIDDIMKSYNEWENILKTKKENIKNIVNYILENKSYLESLGFAKYNTLFELLEDSVEYHDEIISLMWENQEYNYLVVLQNTNEVRPNWGFFGSFALVTIYEGRIKNIELVDSYFMDYILPWSQIELPTRASKIFMVDTTWFVSGNKFWFTDIDGYNLKKLYEKIFHAEHNPDRLYNLINPDQYNILKNKNIKWVVFVRLDTVQNLLAGFYEKSWEWQFLNAASLVMNGDESKNKKEIYMQQARDLFLDKIWIAINNWLWNMDKIIEDSEINIYLSNVSTGLNNFLVENNLKTNFEEGVLYSWDMNHSYNKIDWFVDKVVEIRDNLGQIVYSNNMDKIDISNLEKGTYQMEIIYTLNISEQYIDYIKWLEKKHWVELTDRELYILWLQNFNEHTKEDLFVDNIWLLYFGEWVKIQDVIADEYLWDYDTPWGGAIKYKLKIKENNTTKSVKIVFEK